MKKMNKIRQKVRTLIKERGKLEKENLGVRDMVKGTVVEHYKKCGGNCVCREGKLHGPYWYLSYKEGERSRLKYIHVKELSTVKRLAGNYKTFQSNLTRISRINKEIISLMGQIRQLQIDQVSKKIIKGKGC
ncbi:MAG: hypothetical protein KAV18_03870 [Candidatus Omnitrophica bacterium]|nr:hypothetical protein [Candidatus Omnitrophota bacterium]